MSISDLPPRLPPSSLSEINSRLTELARSQDMLFEQLAHLTVQIEKALAATRTSANEAAETHQERVGLVARVTTLEHEVALLKGRAA